MNIIVNKGARESDRLCTPRYGMEHIIIPTIMYGIGSAFFSDLLHRRKPFKHPNRILATEAECTGLNLPPSAARKGYWSDSARKGALRTPFFPYRRYRDQRGKSAHIDPVEHGADHLINGKHGF